MNYLSYYSIDDIFAGAWQNAIMEVAAVLGISGNPLRDDWAYVEKVARELGVRFTSNGEIINKRSERDEEQAL